MLQETEENEKKKKKKLCFYFKSLIHRAGQELRENEAGSRTKERKAS